MTRRSSLMEKYLAASPQFEFISSKEEAEHRFGYLFSSRNIKYLRFALERFFDGATLDEIGKRNGCSRQYVNECEEKALDIISHSVRFRSRRPASDTMEPTPR